MGKIKGEKGGNKLLNYGKILLNKRNANRLISPIKFTFYVLIIWLVGVLLGVGINMVITKYILFDTTVQYSLLILAFVLASAIIGMPLAYLISKKLTKIINDVNDSINRVAEGDYTAKLNPITKNPQINATVDNFNKMVKQLNSVSMLKNDFISGFSHEFKTPIVSIKGYAELLLDVDSLNAEQKEYLRVIIEESQRLSKLSENVMMLAKLDSQVSLNNVVKFSLDGQIEDCVLLLDSSLKEKDIEVKLDLNSVSIESEPDLIKEIWINLLTNSIKFSKEKGVIEISLKENENNEVVVKVKDNGIGMTEETKANIFEKFYQIDSSHSSKGIGLGLSIVSGILKIVGGSIDCQSQLGKGTEMTVILKNQPQKEGFSE